MSESVATEYIVATLKPCDQYRFRVQQPESFSQETRARIRKKALHEANETFLKCTRNYQRIAWADGANLAFADGRMSPSDSKSEFLHALICMHIIELCFLELQKCYGSPLHAEFNVNVETALPPSARRYLASIARDLGIGLKKKHDLIGTSLLKRRIGGIYRAAKHVDQPFTLQPIRRLEIIKNVILRCVSAHSQLKRCLNWIISGMILLFWPIPIFARLIFGFYYRHAATKILRKLNSTKNVFVYFDLRLGRNRDVSKYMRWKYGTAFETKTGASTIIPFTHLARFEQVYSFSAMIWAYQALKSMEDGKASGCFVVNYLLPAASLFQVHVQGGAYQRDVRRRLLLMKANSSGYFEKFMYAEFISNLSHTRFFPIELSKSYECFFGGMFAGAVLQADAVSKTARHFTASARKYGNHVLYVADRICTHLRTSNQLIDDGFESLHFPNRFIVFDQVTRAEFRRQGVVDSQIYSYTRDFSIAPTNDVCEELVKNQVVILLQAYEDNIGGMVRLGGALINALPDITVTYQEHPNFPVCNRVKADLARSHPKRLRFLAAGEKLNYQTILCLVTGYSTAAVPGILKGIPLVWLRRQVDNSIYGEDYLQRIGFVADKFDEVISRIRKIANHDSKTLEACVSATTEARSIFMPFPLEKSRDFGHAIMSAIDDSFEEIRMLNINT
jgi:hypothetical protein